MSVPSIRKTRLVLGLRSGRIRVGVNKSAYSKSTFHETAYLLVPSTVPTVLDTYGSDGWMLFFRGDLYQSWERGMEVRNTQPVKIDQSAQCCGSDFAWIRIVL